MSDALAWILRGVGTAVGGAIGGPIGAVIGATLASSIAATSGDSTASGPQPDGGSSDSLADGGSDVVGASFDWS